MLDDDGELVTFSSDEELVEALGSIQGEVFRVFIKVSVGQGNNEQKGTASLKLIDLIYNFRSILRSLRVHLKQCLLFKDMI